jgi:hypothetical protein
MTTAQRALAWIGGSIVGVSLLGMVVAVIQVAREEPIHFGSPTRRMYLSKAQRAAIEKIKSGALHAVQSNTVIGRTVASLINAGVVLYKTKTYERRVTSPWGAVHPGFTSYNGLFVIEEPTHEGHPQG